MKQRLEQPINLNFGKVPPQARDLEVAVLGAIMLERHAFDASYEYLRPEMFYVDAHKRIYQRMVAMQSKNIPIDILTVVHALRESEELDDVGGAYYVTQLTNEVTSTAHIEAHSRIIVQAFILRELIRLGGSMIADAYKDGTDAFDLLNKVEAGISDVGKKNIRSNQVAASTLAMQVVERVNHLVANPGSITGVTTGYKILDKITGGWQPTDLIIVAARPSVGKTAFALNLGRNAAMNKIPVAIFSLEMSSSQLGSRIIAAQGEIPLEMINNGVHMDNPINYARFIKASEEFAELPIHIDDTPALNIIEFKSIVRRLHRKHGIGLVIVDYLQLMGGKTDADVRIREQEISNISRNLKATAKELNVPVIALSQMTRSVEKEKREPVLSDLRESGAIEQDADMVMFLYRPTYQNAAAEGDKALKNEATIKIAKHRNGKLDTIPMRIDLQVQRWYDPEFVPGGYAPIGKVMGENSELPF